MSTRQATLIQRAVIAVVLGAVSVVVVAWSCTAIAWRVTGLQRESDLRVSGASADVLCFSARHCYRGWIVPGFESRVLNVRLHARGWPADEGYPLSAAESAALASAVVPSWAVGALEAYWADFRSVTGKPPTVAMPYSAGWPMKALGGLLVRPGEAPHRWTWRFPSLVHNNNPYFVDFELPLRPIPLGFVVNTVVFAVIWSVILFGPRAIRDASRRRRGACLNCGYLLRGVESVECPECGHAAPQSRGVIVV